jgi:hypothetical protein
MSIEPMKAILSIAFCCATRGKSVKKSWSHFISLLVSVGAGVQAPAAGPPADQALARLMAGISATSGIKEQHPDQSLARRKELTARQHSVAVMTKAAFGGNHPLTGSRIKEADKEIARRAHARRKPRRITLSLPE